MPEFGFGGVGDLAKLVFKDDLTELHNRRFMYYYLGENINWKTTTPNLVSLLMIDVDSFKEINDTFGHLEGDNVLKRLGQVIKENVRPNDITIRYAGDEFTVLMPATDKKTAHQVGESIRKKVKSASFTRREGKESLSLSISLGVATAPEDAAAPDKLLDEADKALYTSKRSGKNMVSIAGELKEEIVSERELLATLPSPTFVRREETISELTDFFGSAEAGKNIFVLVEGETGVGKTRLLKELDKRLSDKFFSLFILCNEPDIHIPYKPVINFLKKAQERNKEWLAQALSRIPEGQLFELKGVMPELPCEKPQVDAALSEKDRRKVMFEGLVNLLIELSKEKIIVLFLDEFQNTDEGTMEIVNCLNESDRGRVIICGALRTAILNVLEKQYPIQHKILSDLSDSEAFKHITLARFDAAGTSELINTILQKRSGNPEFDDKMYEITKGTPLFIEETVKNLILKKYIIRKGAAWEFKPIKDEAWSGSQDEVIQENLQLLDKLTPALPVGQVVEKAAVIGRQLNLEVLKEVSNTNEGEALEMLDKAKEARLIEETEPMSADNFTFLNQRIKEVTYEGVDTETRQGLHEQIGQIEEERHKDNLDEVASALAFHYKKAGNEEKAAEFEKRTEFFADNLFRHNEVMEYYEHGKMIVRSRIKEAMEPLTEAAMRTMREVLRGLIATAKNMKLYPDGSQIISGVVSNLNRVLESIFNQAEAFTFSEVKNTLQINTEPADPKVFGTAVNEWLTMLKDHYIKSCTFRRGVTNKEIELFLKNLDNSPEKDYSRPGYWNMYLEDKQIENIGIAQRAFVAAQGKVAAKVAFTAEKQKIELTPETTAAIKDLLRYFCAAVENVRLYPSGSQLTTQVVGEFNKALSLIFNHVDVVNLGQVEDVLLINGVNLSPRVFGASTNTMVKFIRENNFQSISLGKDVMLDELERFLGVLSDPPPRPEGGEVSPEDWNNILTAQGVSNVVMGQTVYSLAELKKGLRKPDEARSPEAVAAAEKSKPVVPVKKDEELLARVDKLLKSLPDKLIGNEFIEIVNKLSEAGEADYLTRVIDKFLQNLSSTRPEMRSRAASFYTNSFDRISGLAKETILEQAAPVFVNALKSEKTPSVFAAFLDIAYKHLIVDVENQHYDRARKLIHSFTKERASDAEFTPEMKEKGQGMLKKFTDTESFNILLNNLKSTDSMVQTLSAQILTDFGPMITHHLIGIIQNTEELYVREATASVINGLGAGATSEFLNALNITTAPEHTCRMIAVLDIVAPQEIEMALSNFIRHANSLVREETVNVLKRLDKTIVLKVLLPVLDEKKPEIVLLAIETLSSLDLKESTDDIIVLLKTTGNKRLQKECCKALGKLDDEKAVPALIEVLGKRSFLGFWGGFSDEVRGNAVWALGDFKTPPARDALLKATNDKSPQVRSAAKLGLKEK